MSDVRSWFPLDTRSDPFPPGCAYAPYPAMLDRFIPRWIQPRSPDEVEDRNPDQSVTIATITTTSADTDARLPLPVEARKPSKVSSSKPNTKWKGSNVTLASGASISRPIPSSAVSLTGIDAPDSDTEADASGFSDSRWNHQYHPYPHNSSHSHPSPTRSGPSNVEWVVGHEEDVYGALRHPPPAVVRLDSNSQRQVNRSSSAPLLSTPTPTPASSSSSSPSPSSSVSQKGTLRLNTSTIANANTNTNPFAQAYTFPTGTGAVSVSTDVYNHAYNYPLAKQLSPIIEQDYFSPTSLRTGTSGAGSVYGHGSQGRGSFGYAVSMGSVQSGSGSSIGADVEIGNGNGAAGDGKNSPGSSVKSGVTRPPSFSAPHPFITRQLNRTISQTSQASTSSSLPRPSPSTTLTPQKSIATTTSTDPPSLSSLSPSSLVSPFAGPHPSTSKDGTRLRRSYVVGMPTIPASTESGHGDIEETSEVYGGEEDSESLHAESFVTAAAGRASRVPEQGEMELEMEMDIADADALYEVSIDGESTHSLNPNSNLNLAQQSTTSLHALPDPAFPSAHISNSTSSYVPLRWDLDAPLGTGVVALLRPKNTPSWLAQRTPAFWAFWLGLVFPVLWFVGGWHFTRVGECPAKVGVWEFYFFGNAGVVWRRVGGWLLCGCCGRRKREGRGDVEKGQMRKGKEKEKGPEMEVWQGQGQGQGPRLPRWVTEKQSSDLGRLRLQDPKRSLRGISFGYPFVPRPVSARRTSTSLVQPARWHQRAMSIITKPHRLFDCFYGVKLREVRGRPESGRRVFDPWIQRCRYAFCYALFTLCVGLCVACTLLIVLNTRQLG